MASLFDTASRLHDLNNPRRGTILESDETRRARLATALALARKAVRSLSLEVGRDEAEKILRDLFKRRQRPKGKQAKKEWNASLLEEYDRQIGNGFKPGKAVTMAANELCPITDDKDIESVKKQIRRLRDARLKKQARKAKRNAEASRGTILGTADKKKADI